MSDKLTRYKEVKQPLDEKNEIWPLYGAGLDNLGQDGHAIQVEMPQYGPDELLVRHDACGLCFSDIKVIRLGEEHPRIYRSMRENPVVLGHEVSMTVVGVGENLRNQYKVGDRFIIQADVWVNGVGYAYGYEIQGGLSRYGVIDQRILNGDDGNYLIPVQPTTGYAESALTEPWACVIAAYQLEYRTGLKPGGTTWIIGTPSGEQHYTISAGFDAQAHPARLLLSNVPPDFKDWLLARAAELGIEVVAVNDLSQPPVDKVDDIVILGSDAETIEKVSPYLADFGIVAVIAEEPLPRKVSIDMGRVHYNRWVYVGGRDPDIAQAYSRVPVRSSLRPGGRALFVGAGGPMGRMHVQRAIQVADGPKTVVCTDVSDLRLDDLRESFAGEAEAKGITFICLNPMNKEAYAQGLAPFKTEGFDDVIVLAPVPAVIEESAGYLAPQGVMNVFAGVARGTKVNLNLSDVYLRDVRYIGHSASTIDDLRQMLHQAESGELSPNRAVAAIGSLGAVKDGLQAVQDASFPGKVVIFPHIKDMPLTALPDLKEKLPTVYAKLKDGREWTVEAEAEFLELMLP
jgi:D-arabinose 1-dehydrogenase-like Zn-dependent alcohol dehydrogenase